MRSILGTRAGGHFRHQLYKGGHSHTCCSAARPWAHTEIPSSTPVNGIIGRPADRLRFTLSACRLRDRQPGAATCRLTRRVSRRGVQSSGLLRCCRAEGLPSIPQPRALIPRALPLLPVARSSRDYRQVARSPRAAALCALLPCACCCPVVERGWGRWGEGGGGWGVGWGGGGDPSGRASCSDPLPSARTPSHPLPPSPHPLRTSHKCRRRIAFIAGICRCGSAFAPTDRPQWQCQQQQRRCWSQPQPQQPPRREVGRHYGRL